MKHYHMLLLWILISVSVFSLLSAQGIAVSIGKLYNLPHVGDSIVKQQMEFVDPGASGRDIIWDFRGAFPVNDSYNLRYRAIPFDTLQMAGIEHQTIYRYRVQGDTLLHTGYENSTTLMEYSQPEIRMRFPFRYGDSIVSRFMGKGEYCHRLPLHVAGKTIITADAAGILFTPDGNEYNKVLRIKSLRNYTETGVDSVTLRLEMWSWYVSGNRYPVFETIKTSTQKAGKKETEHRVASFFYPPSHQILQTDTVGLSGMVPGSDYLPEIDRIFTNCRLLPNPVQSQLLIEYDLTRNVTLNFSIYDAMGVPRITTSPIHRQPGHYTETISMGRLSNGVYPLYVTVNGMVKTLHVVKQ